VDVHVVAEVVIDAEEIEHVAGFAARAATEADGGDRQAAEEPDGDIEVVDVLLDDVVAGKLGEVEPVAGQVGGVGLALVAALDPRHGAVPLDHAALDLADGSGIDERLVAQVAGLVAALGAGDDGQALGGLAFSPVAMTERAPTGSTATGFSMKQCLPASTAAAKCSGGMPAAWPSGRSRSRNRSPSDSCRSRRSSGSAARPKRFAGGLRLVLEGIAGGGDFGLDAEDFAGGHEILERAIAAAAAADQADLDFFASALRRRKYRGGGKAGAEQGGIFQEMNDGSKRLGSWWVGGFGVVAFTGLSSRQRLSREKTGKLRMTGPKFSHPVLRLSPTPP
jgi:hypothetical protein